MVANTRQHTRASRLRLGAQGIGRQRHGDHVLADSPIPESGARAVAADLPTASGEFGTTILGTRDLRQHAVRFNDENLHLTAAMISLAAREHRVARKVSQRIGAEAGLILGLHISHRSKSPDLDSVQI